MLKVQKIGLYFYIWMLKNVVKGKKQRIILFC